MKFILGRKQNMAEFFSPDGKLVPVTVVSAGPITVTKILQKEKDGYEAVQIGYEVNKKKKNSFKVLKEFRFKPTDKNESVLGNVIDVSTFTVGDKLQVSSFSKGKGFQGVVKRHGFHGGPRTHGQKHSEREPGSIGGGLRTHVPKGMRMAGRIGSDRITQKNLEVILIDPEKNLLLIKGAIAGRRGTLVEIISR